MIGLLKPRLRRIESARRRHQSDAHRALRERHAKRFLLLHLRFCLRYAGAQIGKQPMHHIASSDFAGVDQQGTKRFPALSPHRIDLSQTPTQ